MVRTWRSINRSCLKFRGTALLRMFAVGLGGEVHEMPEVPSSLLTEQILTASTSAWNTYTAEQAVKH